MDTLFIKSAQHTVVKIHPVVVFSILDSFLRREQNQEKVVGSLLGRCVGGIYEVTNVYTVPHQHVPEEGVVKFGVDYNITMRDLQRRVSPTEQIVGWFSTVPGGPMITTFTYDIHEEYSATLAKRPVHLVIDTSLQGDALRIKAFVQKKNSVTAQFLVLFQELPVVLESSDVEKIGMDMMIRGLQPETPQPGLSTGMDVLEGALKKLSFMLDTVTRYVDDVVAGKQASDPAFGRMIAETLAAIPHVDPREFEKLFNSSLQDLLMVVYLTNLIQTHIGIAEKITSSLRL